MLRAAQQSRNVSLGILRVLLGPQLTETRSCATALSHPTYGSILFQTSISLSDALSKLVMMLHRRPELTSRLKVTSGDEENKSIVESAADTIQKIFTTC